MHDVETQCSTNRTDDTTEQCGATQDSEGAYKSAQEKLVQSLNAEQNNTTHNSVGQLITLKTVEVSEKRPCGTLQDCTGHDSWHNWMESSAL